MKQYYNKVFVFFFFCCKVAVFVVKDLPHKNRLNKLFFKRKLSSIRVIVFQRKRKKICEQGIVELLKIHFLKCNNLCSIQFFFTLFKNKIKIFH